MTKILTVKSPTTRERLTLRLMIFLGVVAMFFFLRSVLDDSVKGNRFLYWMLLITFLFTCLKILHEWCHYLFITVPETPESTKTYTVDIFTTFCAGEPYEMIEETLLALTKIKYPHQSYLCDEANDPYLVKLCAELGVHHVTRIKKINAKAGNINNALRQSSGELCVVLDPDHVPAPEFLDPIVAHFDDPSVGYVQIVQAYKNDNEGLIAKGAAQQTYQFYGPMMMTMNKYGTVLAIGANCTFRRAALESIGGHAAGLAEDMHTSMQLHAKGWKSVYVPAVLARGLVPTTLSAYYQQQLKWSRGVFDLLVTAYPKLFTQFTWQQKLHYGVIPLHYASGLIFLINFLIPIIALFFNISPMVMDIGSFGIAIVPLIAAIVLIRHYVQWWVMEDDERGFHVVGGLLMIGTWWIFITGIVYTILRKKVPYVPTPKDGQEDSNWILNIPNGIILLLSASAIGYGLWTDWNPYNIVMAGFAGLNCFFMFFTIVASRQHHFRKWKVKHQLVNGSMQKISSLKGYFWLIRRRLYSGVRSAALLLTVLVLSTILYLLKFRETTQDAHSFTIAKDSLMLWGSPAHGQDNRQILPINLATTDSSFAALQTNAVKKATAGGASLLINWQADSDFIVQMNSGMKESYLQKMATFIRSADYPVFLLLILEPKRKPSKTLTTNGLTENEYNIGWSYMRQFFIKNGGQNLIWVWDIEQGNPGNELLESKQIDWLAAREWKETYRRNEIFQHGIPVMLIETDTTKSQAQESEWLMSSLKAKSRKANSIHAIVSGLLPDTLSFASQPNDIKLDQSPAASLVRAAGNKRAQNVFEGLKGVNYTKGQDWRKQAKVFPRTELEADLADMSKLDIKAIKHYGPGIYDRNILRATEEAGMLIHYGFWIPLDTDFITDKASLESLKSTIINTVEDLKGKKQIASWHLGNPVIQLLSNRYYKPDLLYQRQACLRWLEEVVSEIKKIDPKRTVTLDVLVTPDIQTDIDLLKNTLPDIDAFGLVFDKYMTPPQELKKLQAPYFISYAGVEQYAELADNRLGAFISSWQDSERTDKIALDGIKDLEGRTKSTFLTLRYLWKGSPTVPAEPTIRILKPSAATFPGITLSYQAMIWKNGKWNLVAKLPAHMKYEWKLVQIDQYKNPVSIKSVGSGATLQLEIPQNPDRYRLYLYGLEGNTLATWSISELNTPLVIGKSTVLR